VVETCRAALQQRGALVARLLRVRRRTSILVVVVIRIVAYANTSAEELLTLAALRTINANNPQKRRHSRWKLSQELKGT